MAGVELNNPFPEACAGQLYIVDGDSEFQVNSSQKIVAGSLKLVWKIEGKQQNY
jgi:hypothetical protein